MFDDYTVRQGDTHQYTTVTEQRAPTDASVQLLREMEKAAQDKIISSIALNGNDFNCVVHTMMEIVSDRILYKVIFDLNRKRIVVDHSDYWPSDYNTQENALIALRDKVAKAIANEIAPAFTKAIRDSK